MLQRHKNSFVYAGHKSPVPFERGRVKMKSFSNWYFSNNSKRSKIKKTKIFFDAGQFYWGAKDTWLKNSDILNEKSVIFEMPYTRSIDINFEEDWAIAEALYRKKL